MNLDMGMNLLINVGDIAIRNDRRALLIDLTLDYMPLDYWTSKFNGVEIVRL